MGPRGRHPASSAGIAAAAAVAALVLPAAAGAADLPACPPAPPTIAWLASDVPAQVVFGRSVSVSASVRPGVTDARLELRTAAGTLLAVSTAVAPGPQTGVIRIPALPTPVGGTRSLTARLSFTAQQGSAACRAGDSRTIRLVPGRLGRLRIDHRPGGAAVTIRTAAGEGCQDYLRASRVQVRLTDLTAPSKPTQILESVHPCDGWRVVRRARSPRVAVVQADANLVLRPRAGAGRVRLTIVRSGAVVARGIVVVSAAGADFVPDDAPLRG